MRPEPARLARMRREVGIPGDLLANYWPIVRACALSLALQVEGEVETCVQLKNSNPH